MKTFKTLIVFISTVLAIPVFAQLMPLKNEDLNQLQSGASCWLEDEGGELYAFSDGKNLLVKINNEPALLVAEDPFFRGGKDSNTLRYLGTFEKQWILVELIQNTRAKDQWKILFHGTTDRSLPKSSKEALRKRCGA